jgi:hypothetical protein
MLLSISGDLAEPSRELRVIMDLRMKMVRLELNTSPWTNKTALIFIVPHQPGTLESEILSAAFPILPETTNILSSTN